MRGEHPAVMIDSSSTPGSSPHARGAHGAAAARKPEAGIIPACAGSTMGPTMRGRSTTDHPRMRGEHSKYPSTARSPPGSSPHARGALGVIVRCAGCEGIIPACAGSTTHRRCDQTRRGDHPRMRGEHSYAGAEGRHLWGSSPHARGAHLDDQGVLDVQRIIPACAGSTTRRRGTTCHRRDHPRMRGEHPTDNSTALTATGSSPHARGALRGGTFHPRLHRDHPRMRGEHSASASLTA